MSGVENARVRLDGTMTTLDAVTPRIANGGFEASPDLTGWHLTNKTDPQYDAYSWYGGVDRSGTGGTDGTAFAALSFEGSSWDAGYTGTGPSIVTDAAFSARAGEHITFDFVLMASGDTAIVHADLIDATTGAVVQQLFRQEQGESDYWYTGPYAGSATAANSAAIAATGSYKLAIALDSFDSTYGGYIGAALQVDHVVIA
jgi:hypothetical protein